MGLKLSIIWLAYKILTQKLGTGTRSPPLVMEPVAMVAVTINPPVHTLWTQSPHI